ncbi:L-2-amino-thiazoline-4-carboxylic acid hydrolase [Dethiosulfatarculus sandiegensis]|uniref:L-2-amino-thiazoline-4-carboxylic acid hydrolase n=1 Tax=Dethiosulfatarculus sandiegensis TaxID=1429043 RepID=A0A0D2IYG4_9BACT|nr:L-2-amino-thiazoline-4-carboxylic acid hydrolase [Dethiosulfatarculus sandiegensis]KIX11034.1 hypothetical protein X474_27420 [Dethiosulfatarculus sandiegensis]
MQDHQAELIAKVRAAIKDRAIWFALLYKKFSQVLPEDQVEKLCREAIFEFGHMKGASDVKDFSPQAWVQRHKDKGSALMFDSEIEIADNYAIQKMRYCALVEAWKELGLPPEKVALYCDIAMEGDRGRADYHGVNMELSKTLGGGDPCCVLKISQG